MEQSFIDNNSLGQENLISKFEYVDFVSGEKQQTHDDSNSGNTIIKLNRFSTGLSSVPYHDVFQYMVRQFKDIFKVNLVWIANFDEDTSSFVIKHSSLSPEINNSTIKLLGRKINNLGVQFTNVQLDKIVAEKYRETSSVYELSMGAVPETVGKMADKLLDVSWFRSAIMLDNEKLIGSIILGGNSNQTPPTKDELLIFVGISVQAICRKKAEHELYQTRIQNAAMLKALPDLVLVQNSKGNCIDFHTPEHLAQLSSFELFAGKSIADLLPKDQVKKLKPIFKKAVKTKELQVREFSQLLPDGKHDYEARIIAFNEDNILSIIRDITDRNKAEKALRESEEKYRTMVQYSSDPIFSFNPDESYRFVNDVFAKSFGKRPEEIIGKTPHAIFPFDEAEKRLTLVRKVFKSGQKGEIEVKVVSPDGSINYFITIVDPIKDKKGNILWVSCISKNITERILSEMKIKQQNEELIELNKTKDKFFSIIAHDLKNPFNSLLGLSELLLENFENFEKEKIKEFVGYISLTSNQAYKLLENLLEWSRIQQGILKPVIQKRNLKTIVEEIDWLNDGIAKKKSIKLINNLVDDIFIKSDSEMTKSILRNLISNAIKFTNINGLVSISVNCSNSEALISVKDSGIGIPMDKIQKLFQMDKNISTKGTDGESGNGLGLLICKGLAEMQEGKLWVESEVDKGSTFYFSLPLYNEAM